MDDTHNAFGPTDAVNLRTIADTVRGIRTAALPSETHDDVLVMLEYMRVQLVRQHDQLSSKSHELAQREAKLIAREKALALRERAVGLAEKLHPKQEKALWFRGFRGH